MKIRLIDPNTGAAINEVGSGSVLSVADLGPTVIRAFPSSDVSVASVEISVGGQSFVINDLPAEITVGSTPGADIAFPLGSVVVSAVAYSGTNATGSVVDQRSVDVTVIEGQNADGSVIQSEFEQRGEAEAEGEAETEVEAGAGRDSASGAAAVGAFAAAAGSNALTQTLASGSISVRADVDELTPGPLPQGNTNSTTPGAQIAGSAVSPAGMAGVIAEAEGEAEVEIEAEAEANVASGAASAVAGVGAAAASVGSQLADDDVELADVFTAIDGSSSTSTSTALNPGIDRGEDSAIIDANVSMAARQERNTTDAQPTFGEAEVETEAEAEVEAQAGDGVAAAAAGGATGVATVGNYAVADAATSTGTGTSASGEFNAEDLISRFATESSEVSGSTNAVGSATVDDVTISQDSPVTSDPQTDSKSSLSSAEAEIGVESEAEAATAAGNNAAAVAVIGTSGAGAAGIGSDTLASASTSGSVSTLGHAGTFRRDNDLTQIDGDLTGRDPAFSEGVIQGRGANAMGDRNSPGSEAEADGEAEASAVAPDGAFGNTGAGSAVSTSGVGDSVANAQLQLTGDAGRNAFSPGVQDIDERQIQDVSDGFIRELANQAPDGIDAVETEAEAAAEVEIEADISNNSAAAGAAATSGLGHTFGADTSLGVATSAATSTSVFDDLANNYAFSDQTLPTMTEADREYEVETEAEAEAEVGIGAGAAAAAAAPAGYEDILTSSSATATENSAAAASAAGQTATTFVVVPDSGMEGSVRAYAAAWDTEGRGVAAAIAIAGTPLANGADNEFEIEAEGDFSVVLDFTLQTEDVSDGPRGGQSVNLQDNANNPNAGAVNATPDLGGEAEAEVEAEAEAGVGVAAAAAGAAAAGFAATTSSIAVTSTNAPDYVFATLLEGTDGTNAIFGTIGSNIIEGRGGNDALSGLGSADLIEGGDGDDRISGGTGNDILNGGEGNDTIFDTEGDNFVDGGAGNDRIFTQNGENVILGGAGNDTVFAADGDDAIFGGVGNDRLNGRDGADRIEGGEGGDFLSGGNDDDIRNGGIGADRLSGGNGIDTADYSTATAPLRADLFDASVNLGEAEGDTYDSIENLLGSDNEDGLIGNTLDNNIVGGIGEDSLYGRGGNDVLNGGAGADRLLGNDGFDTADYSTAAAPLRADLFNSTVNLGEASGDTYDSIENLLGSSNNDGLLGNTLNNSIVGGAGNDSLFGRGGNDTLNGGTGDDRLFGGDGRDTFIFTNGDGDDTLDRFADGVEVITFVDTGLGFHDLTISDSANGAVVDYGSGTVTLAGINASQLDSIDFEFV